MTVVLGLWLRRRRRHAQGERLLSHRGAAKFASHIMFTAVEPYQRIAKQSTGIAEDHLAVGVVGGLAAVGMKPRNDVAAPWWADAASPLPVRRCKAGLSVAQLIYTPAWRPGGRTHGGAAA